MKFKIDENLPTEIRDDLVAQGHDAETVFDEGLVGVPDPQLVDSVQSEQRVLLTMDKGLGDVRKYPPDQYSGIVLFRPATQGRGTTLAFIRRHLPTLLTATLSGKLLVVSESGIRIR